MKITAHTYRTPKSMLLYLQSNDKEVVGEISPLSGWSRETLEMVASELDTLLPLLSGEWKGSNYLTKLPPMSPSVAFGIELSLAKLLDPVIAPMLPVSLLLVGSEEEILRKAKGSHAKLKLGHLSPEDAVDLCKKVLPKVAHLRVDVNRAWNLKQALFFASRFSPDTFDYIEEPVQTFEELAQFDAKSNHPIAVDEHFREKPLEKLFEIDNLKAFILKPTLQGGLSYFRPIVDKLHGYDLIMSSCYEGAIGKQQIVQLSHRLHLKPLPAGLDT